MKIIGYVAEYPNGSYAHPYGEGGSIKLFLKKGSVTRYHKKAIAVPVFVEQPIRTCTCGRPENDHNVRHPFVPTP